MLHRQQVLSRGVVVTTPQRGAVRLIGQLLVTGSCSIALMQILSLSLSLSLLTDACKSEKHRWLDGWI